MKKWFCQLSVEQRLDIKVNVKMDLCKELIILTLYQLNENGVVLTLQHYQVGIFGGLFQSFSH